MGRCHLLIQLEREGRGGEGGEGVTKQYSHMPKVSR